MCTVHDFALRLWDAPWLTHPWGALHEEWSVWLHCNEYGCVRVNQVMVNPERLSKTAERVVEDFCWVQWDRHTQRLYYLTHNAAHAQARTTVACMIYVKAQKSFLMTGTEDTLSKQMCFWQDKFVLRCVQFYLNQMCDTVVSPVSVTIISTLSAFCSRCRDRRATWSSHSILSFIKLSSPQLELPLELPSNPFRTVR